MTDQKKTSIITTDMPELPDDANQPVKDHESYELVYLDTERLHFQYVNDTLALTIDDGPNFPRVTLRRATPLSDEDVFIIVRTPETDKEKSHEIGVIHDLDKLDPESKEAVQRELMLFYFVPKIQEIKSIREELGFLYWVVGTDRGEKEFIMRDSVISYMRQITPKRVLIIDINLARFEIPNIDDLDPRSFALAERFLLL